MLLLIDTFISLIFNFTNLYYGKNILYVTVFTFIMVKIYYTFYIINVGNFSIPENLLKLI